MGQLSELPIMALTSGPYRLMVVLGYSIWVNRDYDSFFCKQIFWLQACNKWHMCHTAGWRCYARAEAAVHATQACVDRHSATKVLVKLNFQNAFNNLPRQSMLDIMRADFPALSCLIPRTSPWSSCRR